MYLGVPRLFVLVWGVPYEYRTEFSASEGLSSRRSEKSRILVHNNIITVAPGYNERQESRPQGPVH